MVFRHKRKLRVSASGLLLPFVSSELGDKTTIKTITPSVLWMTRCTVALGLWPQAKVPSGHPQHLGVIVLTIAQKGMKQLYTVLTLCILQTPKCDLWQIVKKQMK